mgnify:CR=1 FL=1
MLPSDQTTGYYHTGEDRLVLYAPEEAAPILFRVSSIGRGQAVLRVWRLLRGNYGLEGDAADLGLEGGRHDTAMRSMAVPLSMFIGAERLVQPGHLAVGLLRRPGTCLLYTSPSPRDS